MSRITASDVNTSAKRFLPINICVEDSNLMLKDEITENICKMVEEIAEISESEKNAYIELRVSSFSNEGITVLSDYHSVNQAYLANLKKTMEENYMCEGKKGVKLFDCLKDTFISIEKRKRNYNNSFKPMVLLIGTGNSDKKVIELPKRVSYMLKQNLVILTSLPVMSENMDISIYEKLCCLGKDSEVMDCNKLIEIRFKDFAKSVEQFSSTTAGIYNAFSDVNHNLWKELK